MRFFFLLFLTGLITADLTAQTDKDSTLPHCPLFITDTMTANNFFIEARPSLLKVYRVKGKLTIQLEQKDQFFTLYFHEKKLRPVTYSILPGSRGKNEVEAAYSFRSDGQSSFISVANGTIETVFDEEKKQWQLKINGMIINRVERIITYYRVRCGILLDNS